MSEDEPTSGGALEDLHRHLGRDAGGVGQGGEAFRPQSFVGGEVLDRDEHEVVGLAEQAMTRDHLVEPIECRFRTSSPLR